MNLEKIIAISGRPGLFQMLTQTRTSIVAVSLIDGKRISTNISNQLSILSEIQIYGIHGEVPLQEIFQKMLVYEHGALARVKPKSDASILESYFFEVFSAYDEDRVYLSDIKKIIQWYNILVTNEIIALEESATPEGESSSDASDANTPAAENSSTE